MTHCGIAESETFLKSKDQNGP